MKTAELVLFGSTGNKFLSWPEKTTAETQNWAGFYQTLLEFGKVESFGAVKRVDSEGKQTLIRHVETDFLVALTIKCDCLELVELALSHWIQRFKVFSFLISL